GFCGAPVQNDEITVPRIGKITELVEHILNLGCNAVYFGPVFESDAHGYDTRDYQKIDRRLGTNKDFADVCQTMH
ncbi:MAG TPA: maltodextrin glucosidase, partial [Ruminococcaceae bacterium]|nr:maltodextrin glucosidase [Oscillospiraceae bacterium]